MSETRYRAAYYRRHGQEFEALVLAWLQRIDVRLQRLEQGVLQVSQAQNNADALLASLVSTTARIQQVDDAAKTAITGLVTAVQSLQSQLQQTGNGLTPAQQQLFQTTLDAMAAKTDELAAAIPANTGGTSGSGTVSGGSGGGTVGGAGSVSGGVGSDTTGGAASVSGAGSSTVSGGGGADTVGGGSTIAP